MQRLLLSSLFVLTCLLTFGQGRLYVDIDHYSKKRINRAQKNMKLKVGADQILKPSVDSNHTDFLYFDLPLGADHVPFEGELFFWGNSMAIHLPASDTLYLLTTDEGDYFPHDAIIWTYDELRAVFIEAKKAKATSEAPFDLQEVPSVKNIRSMSRMVNTALAYRYQASEERVDRMEEIGNGLYWVLLGILGICLLGLMVSRIRLQQEEVPPSRWLLAESRFSQLMYLTIAAFVMHVALYLDSEIISLNGNPGYVMELNTFAEILLGMLILSSFVLNATYLVPNFLVIQDYRGYFLRAAALLGISLLPFVLMNDWLFQTHFAWVDRSWVFHHFDRDEDFDPMAFPAFWWILSSLLVSTFMTINRRFINQRIQDLQRESSRLSANLRQLQAQISPHFFFNSLNSVYGFALQEESPRTVEALEKLSSLMRFAIYDGNQAFIPLSKEMEYLSDYVDMQKLRLDPNHHEVKFDISDYPAGAYIAPLLLINLIENAFKHGLSMREASFIHISVRTSGYELELRVSNSVHPKMEIQHGGVGLSNVRQRLDLLYPNAYV
ncbi:MAG: histidine kinase, partial [Bacteroidota bacterium]